MIFSAAVLNIVNILAVTEIFWYQKEKKIFVPQLCTSYKL